VGDCLRLIDNPHGRITTNRREDSMITISVDAISNAIDSTLFVPTVGIRSSEDGKQIVKMKMDELALKYVVIHDPEIIEELCRLGGELEKMEKVEKQY
jgi:imidazole glycerol phosphate synthase subunit HisF